MSEATFPVYDTVMKQKTTRFTRRRLLRIASFAVGLVGGVAAAVPFIRSMSPSARSRARGAPVRVDVALVGPRAQVTVAWRGKPVWILHRDDTMLNGLDNANLLDRLLDPGSSVKSQQPVYARNPYRSIRPDYLVAVGLCTHLGCVPSLQPRPGSVEAGLPGGYFCPCHGSKFDLAGRVFRGVPAPTNLVIPPYRYIEDNVVEIGVDPEEAKT